MIEGGAEQVNSLSSLALLSFVDLSNNKLKGKYDASKQTCFVDLRGNGELRVKNVEFGEPVTYHMEGESKYECKTVYSRSNVGEERGGVELNRRTAVNYRLQVDESSMGMVQCKCTTGYVVLSTTISFSTTVTK